jgi:hypothetical protein
MRSHGLHDDTRNEQGRTHEMATVDGFGKEGKAQNQRDGFARGGGQTRN